ncbi:MAG: flagellar assembly protein FliW [Oscillospiraceae bacterium]|nr:flagellar assembly protein FliW [Oscillospiraceae bacterium]
MKINTKFFGEIDIADDQLILFPYGIYGFENFNRFVLLHDKEYEEENETVFRFLQCIDDENLCFTVMDPDYVEQGYNPKLPENYTKKLGIFDENEAVYLVIALISENLKESTANMQGPIVINSKNMCGAQIILESSEPENTGYKIKHKIFKTSGEPADGEGSGI